MLGDSLPPSTTHIVVQIMNVKMIYGGGNNTMIEIRLSRVIFDRVVENLGVKSDGNFKVKVKDVDEHLHIILDTSLSFGGVQYPKKYDDVASKFLSKFSHNPNPTPESETPKLDARERERKAQANIDAIFDKAGIDISDYLKY